MPHCFRVYIDESGDEGFKFATAATDWRGSSDWLVLSAVVTREENDLATVKLVEEVRTLLNRPGKELHFREMTHEHRLPYVDRIGKAQLRTISVMIHKPSLEADRFGGEPYQLYRYATRYLLERVSWFCRDKRKPEQRDHTARLIFSNRSSMSYEDMRGYLRLLQTGAVPDVRIAWDALDCDGLQAVPHKAMMGLQIADAVASSMFWGLNRSRLGFVEPRYAQMLANVAYRHGTAALGYGVKFFPKDPKTLAALFPELAWIESTYAPRPAKA